MEILYLVGTEDPEAGLAFRLQSMEFRVKQETTPS